MSGFAKWASSASDHSLAAKGAEAEEKYLVINHLLQSDKRGIRFRRSPSSSDMDPRVVHIAVFGSVVSGVPYDQDWLQVGKEFLPFRVGGVGVLLRQKDEEEEEEEEVPVRPAQVPEHDDCSAGLPDDEAEEPPQIWRPENWVVHDDFILGREVPEAKKPERKTKPSASERLLSALCKDNYAGPPKERGHRYKAVANQVVRQVPSDNGRVFGNLVKGQMLELHNWDATGRWRTCWQTEKLNCWAWVRLDGLQGQALLRPGVQGERPDMPPGWPLDPIITCVFENDLGHLQSFLSLGHKPDTRDAEGRTPLMLAAQWDRPECFVLLLKGGANASLTNPEGKCAADLAKSPSTEAVVQALSGGEFDLVTYEAATRKMPQVVRELAEEMVEAIAAEREAERERERQRAAEAKRIQAEIDRLLAERGRDGAPYRVVAESMPVWDEPMADGSPLDNLVKGQVVELFEWSLTRRWRKCWHPVVRGALQVVWGWVALDDADAGPLLRPDPKGAACSKRPWRAVAATFRDPLDPVCVTVHENEVANLQCLIAARAELNVRDVTGRTPLMLASQWGLTDCCVLLLRGGADVEVAAPEGHRATELAADAGTRALLEALTGQNCDAEARNDALKNLLPVTREAADEILAKKAKEAAERKAAQEAAEAEEARQKAERARIMMEKVQEQERQRAAEFSFSLDRTSQYTLAELEEMEMRRKLEEEEAKMVAGLVQSWNCPDCGFMNPESEPVCTFCDTPRGEGLKSGMYEGS